jgi:hypothetical protein
MRNFTNEFVVMSNKAETGIGAAMDVSDFKHVLLTLATAGSGDMTIKFQASNSNNCPNFAATQSRSNRWDYVQVRDIEDGANVDGDTGVAFSGTDDVRLFEVNTAGQKWICARVTAHSAGVATLLAKGLSNQ